MVRLIMNVLFFIRFTVIVIVLEFDIFIRNNNVGSINITGSYTQCCM